MVRFDDNLPASLNLWGPKPLPSRTSTRCLLAFSLVSLLLAAPVRAFDTPVLAAAPRQYTCPPAEAPPVIDGRLDDPCWVNAPWTAPFTDIEGPLKREPRFRTRAKMTWDATHFYCAAELREPHVWAKLTERDAVIYHDNDFEVFIDPDGDNHLYYELEINALGTEWDLLLIKPYRDGAPALNAWDIAGLQTAVQVDGTLNDPADTDRGWTVEIAIPWSVLAEAAGRPAPPAPGDIWRVNFSRVQWRTRVVDGGYEKITDPETGKSLPEDNWVWSPQGMIAMHVPEMWGEVMFDDGSGTHRFASSREHREITIAGTLMPIYYLQRQFAADRGRFAASLTELGVPVGMLPTWPPTDGQVKMTALPGNWQLEMDASADRFTARLITPELRVTVDEEGRLVRKH